MKHDLSCARGIVVGLLLMLGFYTVVGIVWVLAAWMSGKG